MAMTRRAKRGDGTESASKPCQCNTAAIHLLGANGDMAEPDSLAAAARLHRAVRVCTGHATPRPAPLRRSVYVYVHALE